MPDRFARLCGFFHMIGGRVHGLTLRAPFGNEQPSPKRGNARVAIPGASILKISDDETRELCISSKQTG